MEFKYALVFLFVLFVSVKSQDNTTAEVGSGDETTTGANAQNTTMSTTTTTTTIAPSTTTTGGASSVHISATVIGLSVALASVTRMLS